MQATLDEITKLKNSKKNFQFEFSKLFEPLGSEGGAGGDEGRASAGAAPARNGRGSGGHPRSGGKGLENWIPNIG